MHRLFPGIETHHQPMRVIWRWPGHETPESPEAHLAQSHDEEGLRGLVVLFVDLPAMIRIARFARRRRSSFTSTTESRDIFPVSPPESPPRAGRRSLPSGGTDVRKRSALRAMGGPLDLRSGVMSSRLEGRCCGGAGPYGPLRAGFEILYGPRRPRRTAPPPGRTRHNRPLAVFGIFGRIIRWKGIREFVLAAARVLERDAGAVALVVGDGLDGSEADFEKGSSS